MYKFSNGVVVFTEEDKENFLRAGYTLVEDTTKEEKYENKDNDGVIETKLEQSKKTTSRFRR